MSRLITHQDLFRGDLVQVEAKMFPKTSSEAERRRFVHTTMRHGDTDVELCDNPYNPAKLDYSSISALKLVRRGNWFRRQHSLPLEFDDPFDESLFWMHHIGTTTVRNPEDRKVNAWTRRQALNALSAGIADVFVVTPDSLDSRFGEFRFTGYKLKHTSDIPGGVVRLRELCREALRAMAT